MGDLGRVLRMKDDCDRLQWKIEELQSQAEQATKAFSLAPGRGGDHRADDIYALLIEQKDRYVNKFYELMQAGWELEEELDRCIDNGKVRLAMKYHFVDGLQADKIAKELHCSIRTVRRWLQRGKDIYDKASR